MSSGLSINKHIYQILSSDDKLRKLIGKNIFPLIAEEITNFPFLIFKRNSLEVTYTKDGHCQDTVSIAVAIASKSYNQSVEIAERVRQLLEMKRDDVIYRCILTSVNEDYIDDSYVCELNFQMILN